MTFRFAKLEQRVNNAVLQHFANVSATVSGLPVVGIFDEAYTTASVGIGMASTVPVLTVRDTDLPSDLEGRPVVVLSNNDGCVDGYVREGQYYEGAPYQSTPMVQPTGYRSGERG